MRRVTAAIVGAVLLCALSGLLRAADIITIPWAYGIVPPPPPGESPSPPWFRRPNGALTLPGSEVTMTGPQITDMFNAADWWPNDHPTMPPIVKNGRKPNVRACGVCHYPNGKGKPDNAAVAGLPETYFIQQLLDYRSGARKSADPKKGNALQMGEFAKEMTEAEMKEAARYFGSIPFTPWIRVIETAKVPKFELMGAVFGTKDDVRTEALGSKILEVPEDSEHFEVYRDPRVGFVAYVPLGSVKKGEALATTGGLGKTVACVTCHGGDLHGLGPVPAIAGRSPSYLARQLYDMRAGTRKGAWSDLMKQAVARLTDDDIVNLTAYAASKTP
jgi:cytochrome c553